MNEAKKQMNWDNAKLILGTKEIPTIPMEYNLEVDLFDKISKQLHDNFNDHLEKYLMKNLEQFGIYIPSRSEFLKFCKERITRISSSMEDHELYLDFVDENDRGKLIGVYSSKTEIKQEGNKLTATIGYNTK